MFQGGLAGILVAQVIGVGQNRSNDFFRVPSLFENHAALQWMVWRIWPLFVIEVMEQTNGSPKLDVLA